MSDNNPSSADPFGQIADEFMEACRRGERPSVEEFARRYPAHADEIRDMLPALALMEKAKADVGPHEGSPAPASIAATLRQLGDYQILREVGRGGMGVVYEAQQLSLGRHVALKVLPSHALLDPQLRGRFQREARAAARLHHTNIVPVFGVGEQDGMHYYVMQFIQGLGLDEVLTELRRLRQPGTHQPPAGDAAPGPPGDRTRAVSAAGVARGLLSGTFRQPHPASPLTTAQGEPAAEADQPSAPAAPAADSSATIHMPGQSEGDTLTGSGTQYWHSVARVGMQVADALAHAAALGILHRDIKPSNLLLDEQGNVWVTDFGLAKADSDADNLTHTGDIVGTLRYMAPERFTGRGDLRGDVYSLGLTLYELLMLRPAFDETDRNRLVRQVLHDEPPRLRKLNPAVPRDLETVVLKAIAREPAHRYQTPAELAEDLKRFVEDRPIRARRVSEAEKFWRWCRRNPLPASLLGGIVLVFLVGFAGTFWQWWLADTERQDAVVARDEAKAQGENALKEKGRAEAALYNSNIARAQLEYRANNIAGSERILDRSPPGRRGWEWHFLKGLHHADLFTLRGHTSWVFAVACSPDGKLIASSGGGNPFWRTQGPGSIRPGEVLLWNAGTGAPVHTLLGHQHVIEGIAFSPDGRLLASASQDRTVKLWEVASGKELRTIRAPAGLACVAFSPDGARLAAGGEDHIIRVWEVGSGQETQTLRGHTQPVVNLAFGRDGGRLVSNSHDPWGSPCRARVWDLASGKERCTLESNDTRSSGLALSPDARALVGSNHAAIRFWDPTTGKLLRTFSSPQGKILALAFSPDGQTLASAGEDATIRIWDAGSGAEGSLFRGHAGKVTAVTYSPDGSRLVSGGIDGTVKVWDTTLHPEEATVRMSWKVFPTRGVEALGFAADGRSLTLVRQNPNGIIQIDVTDHTVLHLGSVDLSDQGLSPAEPACLDVEGRWLAGVSQEAANVVKCWEARTGKERVALRGHTTPVEHVTVCPGGRRIATGSTMWAHPDRLGEVKVWDGDSGRPLFELAEKGLGVTRLALSPTGDRLALAGLRIASQPGQQPRLTPFITVYAVEGGRELHDFRAAEDLWYGLSFSGDGRRLAACGGQNRTVLLWDLDTGRHTVTREGPAEGGDVAFSPDGSRLAVGGRRLQKLLDAATGEAIIVLRGESQRVQSTGGHNPRLRWSPDGRRLAAFCGGSISVWSVAEDTPEERAARRQAAEGRAQASHLRAAAESTTNPQVARFHLDQVRDVELRSAWAYAFRGMAYAQVGEKDKAGADYARAARLAPENPVIEHAYGELYVIRGEWEQAVPHFDRYITLGRGDPISLCNMASLPLYVNDRVTFRRQVQQLLDRYGQSRDANVVLNLLMWVVLMEEKSADPQLLVRMADRCLEDPTLQGSLKYLVQVKGMAEYRAGRLEAAAQWLGKAEQLATGLRYKAVISFFLSMAYQRLNRTEEAKAAYQHGLAHMEKAFGGLEKYQHGKEDWFAWPWCQVLRREAGAVLNNTKDPDKPKD